MIVRRRSTRLGEHYVAGRLTGDEHAARSDAAAEARTREELDALLADLPERRRDEALRVHVDRHSRPARPRCSPPGG